MDLLKNAPPESRPLSPIELDGADLRGVEIKREWKNIDLLIRCQIPSFVVVIENKIDSGEHSDQLGRYQRTMTEHYPDARPLFVYLTVSGEEPSDDAWVPYSYEGIHGALSRVRQTYRNAIGDDVLAFLDHYLDLIGTRFMDNPKIDELCQRIYKNHRQALDLIWERVGTPESGVIAKAANALQDDERWTVLWQIANQLNFMPKGWLDWSLPIGTEYEDERVWLILKFRLDGGEISTWLELQGIEDMPKRSQIVEFLLSEAPKCGFKAQQARKRTGTRYTRISAREPVLEWAQGDEPEARAIRTAVRKKLDELHPRLEKLASVLKPLCNVPASPG